MFLVADNFGVLRQVSRFVRQETGVHEIDLYERLGRRPQRPEQWPIARVHVPGRALPRLRPVSWQLLIDEVRTVPTTQLGIADDCAPTPSSACSTRCCRAVVGASRSSSSSRTTSRPGIERWSTSRMRAFDWESECHAGRAPAGHLPVDDPYDVCGGALGVEIDEKPHGSWELASPFRSGSFARAHVGRRAAIVMRALRTRRSIQRGGDAPVKTSAGLCCATRRDLATSATASQSVRLS